MRYNPSMTSGERIVIVRGCPAWRCGKVLVPTKVLMPSSHQVRLECCSVNPEPKGGTQLLLLQRAVKFTQRKVMAEQPAKAGVAEPRRAS